MNDVALVKNAADAKQVRNASRKERDSLTLARKDLLAVLEMPEARRVLWRFICQFKPFDNPTHSRGDITHQNIGYANAGREITQAIQEADYEKWLLMQREAHLRAQHDAREADAVRSTAAIGE